MKKGIGDFGNPIGDSGNVKVNIAKITGTILNIPAKTWTLAIENKMRGGIYVQRKSTFLNRIYTAWLDTGGTAPTLAPGASGSAAVEVESLDLILNKNTATDVYMWSQRAISVTVDTE